MSSTGRWGGSGARPSGFLRISGRRNPAASARRTAQYGTAPQCRTAIEMPLRSILSGTAQRSWPCQPPAISQLYETTPPTSEAEVRWQSGKPLQPSKELTAVVGTGPLPRGEVVSKVWDYIKKHELQNPENRREILADDKLEAVFGKKKVTMFEMNKYLTQHLTSPEAG